MARYYIGQTTSYPTQINGFGGVSLVVDSPLINQSIRAILGTPVGTRFDNPEFGSEIQELQYEPNDSILVSLLDTLIKRAINKWEKRVKNISVTFDFPEDEPDVVNCLISYTYKAKNESDSFVYPFYRDLKLTGE